MDETSRAVSFANNYFALVDGLASGLEDHLAEDVILDWFGRTVKGRRNVSAFIKAHKVNSRHMFTDIAAVKSIGYEKKPPKRRRRSSAGLGGEEELDATSSRASKVATGKSSEINNNEPADENEPKSFVTAPDDDMTYNINELFEREITATSVAEIEESINRMKLEEEVPLAVRPMKRECGQGDGPDVIESNAIKYVEAQGLIEFSRKYEDQGKWMMFPTMAGNSARTWRRSCKLQIAYSSSTENPRASRKQQAKNRKLKPYVRKLQTLEEIAEVSSRLVSSTDKFTACLKSTDFSEHRNDFLKNLKSEIFKRTSCLLSPQYIGNRLVFEKASSTRENSEKQRPFVFNYLIHIIIYEGNNNCRVNLMRKFEKPL